MKVQKPATFDFLSQTDRVESKKDTEGFQEQLDRQNKRQQREEKEVEVTEENVDRALEEFAAERPNGLQAMVAGRGPGLKVVVKDAAGGVVRELSGEEFLKLRESVRESAGQGKLLDKKA